MFSFEKFKGMNELLNDNIEKDNFFFENKDYFLTNILSYDTEIINEEQNLADFSFHYSNNEEQNLAYFPFHYSNNDLPNLTNEKFSTNFISKKKKNNYYDYQNITNNEEEYNDGPEPTPYLLETIIEIFERNLKENQYEKIIKNINFKRGEPRDLHLNKTKKHMLYEDFLKELEEKSKGNATNNNKKRGKQTNIENKFVYHDKMCSDNIIKKIKAILFDYAIKFLNNLLNNIMSNNSNILFKLDYYEYVNRLKRNIDLLYLNTSLKDLFSGKVSLKHLKKAKIDKRDVENEEIKKFINHNCETIKNILNNCGDDTISFIFNMTFRDWIDIFLLKKNINDILDKFKNMNYKNINFEAIKKSLIGIDEVLEKIMNKNQSGDYLTLFIVYLYNYERWFYMKKTKIKKKKISNQKDIFNN